jgi:hypothetical protein
LPGDEKLTGAPKLTHLENDREVYKSVSLLIDWAQQLWVEVWLLALFSLFVIRYESSIAAEGDSTII